MNYILVRLISFMLDFIVLVILLDVIGSWVVALRVRLPGWGYNILQVVHRAADVFLGPIRRFIPNFGGLDLSPFIALLLISFLRRLIITTLV